LIINILQNVKITIMDFTNYLNDLNSGHSDEIYTQLETVYAENSALIQYFGAIDKQFVSWLNQTTFNAKVIATLLPKLETVFAALAGLKFSLEDAEEEIAPQLRPKLEQLQKRIVANMTYQETAFYQQRLEKLLEQNEALVQSNAVADVQAKKLEQERAFAAEKAKQAERERAEQLRQAQFAYQHERKMRQVNVILEENRALIGMFKGVERQFLNGSAKASFSENAVDELITNYRQLLLDLNNLKSQISELQSLYVMPDLKTTWEQLYKSVINEMTWQQRSVYMERLKGLVSKSNTLMEPKMVFIKGGTFMMGEVGVSGAEPVHQVTVSDFCIGKYPVTQAEWKAIMGNNPSHFKGDNLPVEQVSWHDAQEYIACLNPKTGKKYRLPTEAEWEYAAKGGQPYAYAGSDNVHEVAWFVQNSGSKTQPVGTKMANGYGLHDMSGNVSEWCNDWFHGYSNVPVTNPIGAVAGSNRVSRGGGWDDYPEFCRASYRHYSTPAYRLNSIGFRLVFLLQ
jgi:formylglycine-generating enzyme required for sulfatase activity